MNEISSQIARWSEKASRLAVLAEAARVSYRDARKSVDEAELRTRHIEQAQTIAQSIAQGIQEKVHARISSVVSRCLASVFDNPYTFRILFEQKRGRTEAVLLFERNGRQMDPLSAAAGGSVDIAAFALRLSCMMLSRPKLRRVLVLDEPFKSPSPHYRERVKQLIEALSKEMGVQFIIVTNIMELVTGRIIDLDKKDGG